MIRVALSFLFLLTFASSTILLTQPAKNPFDKNQIQYWYANFGQISYNKPAIYQLVVINQGFCKSVQYSKLEHFTESTFVVINGDIDSCPFPQRAIIAQNLGASGIIFASHQIQYAIRKIIYADDGHGRNVRINSLFISPESFEKLKQLKNMMIKVNFPIVQQEISDVNLFLSASVRASYIFVRNFRNFYSNIRNYVSLSLVYHTIECKYCSQKECILQNQCCTFDYENFQAGVGEYIVKQQFRQNQIFKFAKKLNNLDIWFNYMNKFDEQCDYNWVNSQECSNKIQKQLLINESMKNSDFAIEMKQWRDIQTKMGVITFPELAVNGVRHSESLTPISAYSMICESLMNPPESCFEEKKQYKSNKAGLIIGLIVLGAVLLILGVICYRKVIKKQITNDMSARVSELVSKYAAKVSDQKKKKKQKLMEKFTQQI